MRTICEAAPRSDEWLGARREGITATDISVILGDNPYKTPLQLWEDKRGTSAPIPDNTAMRVGRGVEPLILDLASDNHGKIRTFPELPSIVGWEANPLVRASLDGLDETGHPVEAKATRRGWDRVPAHYEAQVLWQTGIVGADYGTLAVLQGTAYDETRIPFDRDWWDWATVEAAAWWERHVVGGDRPPAAPGDDMAALYEPEPDLGVEVPDDIWAAYVGARAVADEARAVAKQLEVEIQDRVGEATTVNVDGKRVATWNPVKGRETLDKRSLFAAHPWVKEQYTNTGKPSRSWRVR